MRRNNLHPFAIGLISGLVTACLFGVAGLLLLKSGVLGSTLFMLLPFATGFAVAMAAYPKTTVWVSLALVTLCGLIGLIAARLEGWLCCLMVLPLIIPGLICGALFGFLIRKWAAHAGSRLMCIGLTGLLVIGSQTVEGRWSDSVRQEAVTTTMGLRHSPDKVWEHLKAFGGMTVERPLLMKVGLPVPVRCRLDGADERIGGKRTCYFQNGYIEEEITVWEPPRLMRVNIVKSTLPGKRWLAYLDAEYEVIARDGGSQVTRTTRIGSQLRPAWYWRFMERMGVETEHRFIFNQLKVNLGEG